MQQTGKYIMIAGAVVLIAGIVMFFWGDKLQFLGRLPGDIRIERENFKFYFPITTMILLSLAISLNIWILRQF